MAPSEWFGHLVGMQFHPPALAVLSALPAGCPLEVRPEPQNEYDPNALAVWLEIKNIPATAHETLSERLPGYGVTLEEFLQREEIQIGYIAKGEAAGIAGRLKGPSSGHLSFSGGDRPRVLIAVPD